MVNLSVSQGGRFRVRRLRATGIPAEAGGSTQRFRFNGDEEVAPRATRASEALVAEGTPERS